MKPVLVFISAFVLLAACSDSSKEVKAEGDEIGNQVGAEQANADGGAQPNQTNLIVTTSINCVEKDSDSDWKLLNILDVKVLFKEPSSDNYFETNSKIETGSIFDVPEKSVLAEIPLRCEQGDIKIDLQFSAESLPNVKPSLSYSFSCEDLQERIASFAGKAPGAIQYNLGLTCRSQGGIEVTDVQENTKSIETGSEQPQSHL